MDDSAGVPFATGARLGNGAARNASSLGEGPIGKGFLGIASLVNIIRT
jgi:hypothetical protein